MACISVAAVSLQDYRSERDETFFVNYKPRYTMVARDHTRGTIHTAMNMLRTPGEWWHDEDNTKVREFMRVFFCLSSLFFLSYRFTSDARFPEVRFAIALKQKSSHVVPSCNRQPFIYQTWSWNISSEILQVSVERGIRLIMILLIYSARREQGDTNITNDRIIFESDAMEKSM